MFTNAMMLNISIYLGKKSCLKNVFDINFN